MCGDSENCAAIIALHKVGKLTSKILLPLRSWKSAKCLCIGPSSDSRKLGLLYIIHGQTTRCRIRTKRLVQTVAAHIQWNSVKNQYVVVWELNISMLFMSGVLRNDLGLKAYQQSTGHFLTLHLKEQRLIKSKCLLQCYTNNGQRRISFHRWKYLQYWGGFQLANWPSLYLNILRNLWQGSKIQRDHHPVSVMVLLGSVVWCHHQAPFLWKRGQNLSQSLWEHRIGACCEAFQQLFVQ